MQPFFPATYSSLSPFALADLITEKYGWTGVRCRLLVRGVGDTYLLETADSRYILRVYRCSHRSFHQIKMETELLTAAVQAGVSVSYPVQDLSGQKIQPLNAIEGQRYGVVFSFAAGKPVRVLNEDQLKSFGREMARFHNVSAGIKGNGSEDVESAGSSAADRWTFDPETTLFNPIRQLEPYYKELPEEYAWLKEAIEQAADRLARVDGTAISTGYCHFDFLPKNFHFDGDKITFYDFDFMGYGWLVNDLMSFWQHLQLDVYAGRMKQAEADDQFSIFLAAYRQVRPVSNEEIAVIPYLTLGFWLFYMGFHTTHDQFFSAIQPATLKVYTAFLKNLTQQHWKP